MNVVWMSFKYNVVLNDVKLTQFEYVWNFAHKVFEKMPKWECIDFLVSYVLRDKCSWWKWCLDYV